MTLWTETLLPKVLNEYNRDPENYLQADPGRNFQPLAAKYYAEMKADKRFKSEWLDKTRAETIWNPFRLAADFRISPMTVQHLYHIMQQQNVSGVDIREMDLIVEIGGGYGNMARILHQHGFEGEYIIVDFKEMWPIQRAYLKANDIDMSKISFIELDLNHIEDKIAAADKAALTGTFSINEMPMEDRKHLEAFYRMFTYVFIIHNFEFDGIDNKEYFNNLKNDLKKDFRTWYYQDAHKRAFFLIGLQS